MKTTSLSIQRKDRFEITSQGFLVVDANLTRAGVFDYVDEGGNKVRENRPPEEVFKQSTLDSMKFAPLTDLHPLEMVNVDNVFQLAKGFVGENIQRRTTPKGDFAAGKVVITDKKQIKEILDKWDLGEDIELSMGYDAKVVDIAGVHPTEGHYDKTQRDIVYNHISKVPKGRAGRDVKLIMDAEAEFINKINKDTEVKTVRFIKKAINKGGFHMDAIDAEVNDDSTPIVNKLSDKVDEAVAIIGEKDEALTAAKTDKETAQAKHDQLDEENKKLKADLAELTNPNSPKIQAIIKARSDMEALATKLGVKIAKEGGSMKDSPALRNDIIAATTEDGKFDAGDRDEVYLAARYDAVVGMVASAKKQDGDAKLGTFIVDANKAPEAKVDASVEFSKKSADLCKTPE